MHAESFSIKHDRSKYLKDCENEKLIDYFDTTNGILAASAVTQLYLTKIPENTEWYKKTTGILCLINDLNRRSFFFRLLNLKAQLLWEEELYTKFCYYKITKNFYYFSGYKCNVGFNFAFEDEALKIQRAVEQAVYSLEKCGHIKIDPNNNNTNHRLTINLNYTKKDSNKKVEKKKIIDKNLIGNPTHFVHVNHIGISQDNSLNILLNDQNENVKMIVDVLKQLHIKPDKHVVEYADNFIKSNGGYGKYLNEYKSLKENFPQDRAKSKSDKPKKNPKLMVTGEKQNNKVVINISTTPNTLKPPSRPAPKPPVAKNESLRNSASENPKIVDFLSPISNCTKYDSDGSNYVTPEFITDENGKNFQSRKTSSAISQEENRSALLKSIENFKGRLKHVTPSKNLHINNIDENDPMSQLIKALNAMRPYLNVSSDESDNENSFSF